MKFSTSCPLVRKSPPLLLFLVSLFLAGTTAFSLHPAKMAAPVLKLEPSFTKYHKILPSSATTARNVVLIGTKNACAAVLKEEGNVLGALSGAASGDRKLLSSVLEGMKAGKDKVVSSEVYINPSASEEPVRVQLSLLPTECSRHNSPALPHSVTEGVQTAWGSNVKGDVSVLLVLEDPAHAYAAGCAVARAVPTFHSKLSTPAPRDVNVYFTQASSASTAASNAMDKAVDDCAVTAEGIQLAAMLVDAPPNFLHCTEFTAHAVNIAAALPNTESTVIKGEALREAGMGGIYGVGKAAVEPPALVLLSHTPPDSGDKPSVVWVGKGIVYDTGGLSIKTKTGMPGMKRDMGGAAAILAAFQAAVKSGKCTEPLHAILCLAENSVASCATRPDDIHTLYSGKTVEINNTDAEGRLVLADGVAYAARHLKPKVIIDMATLTGAQGVATGKRHGALVCNDEATETQCIAAGKTSGDLCHAMPYAPEFYKMEFASSVADMKNSVADRANAQVSCAGQFIANHLEDYIGGDGKWLHIDMAYPASKGERATGYGVALLYSLLDLL